MKGLINNPLLIIFLLFIYINCQSPQDIEFMMIPSAYLNATASYATFDKDKFFLYFTFDLDFHKNVSKEKDVACFKISTSSQINSKDIKYTFLDKKLEQVNVTDLDIKNKILWYYGYIANKEKTSYDFNYYIKIKLFGENKNKSTLIIKIDVLNKKGDLTVENIFVPLDETKLKLNDIKDVNKLFPDLKSLEKYYNRTYPYKNHTINNYYGYKNQYNRLPNNHNNYHYHYNYHNYHRRKYRRVHRYIEFSFLGVLLLQVWTIVFILYCIVNRRKPENNRTAIIIGNIQQ